MNCDFNGAGGLCCQCQHWQAVQWDGWMWTDEIALCGLCLNEKKRGHRCIEYKAHTITTIAAKNLEAQKILASQVHVGDGSIGARVNDVDLNHNQFIDAMQEWYKNNQSKFDMVNVIEDVEDEYYKHQDEDFERFKDSKEMALFWTMGCIAEGTIIQYGYKTATYRIPIETAYLKQRRTTKQRYVIGLLEDDTFGLIEVYDMLYSGEKECIGITTESGNTLSLTPEHEVLTDNGWLRADKLTLNSIVICNGYKRVYESESVYSDGYVRLHGYKYKGYPNRRTDGLLKHRYVMEQHLGRYLLPTEYVHHKDGNKLNNDISNLELLDSMSAHAERHHAISVHNLNSTDYTHPTGTTVVKVPKFEHVIGIKNVGIKRTYDIKCADPHNFIANKIVVHNCGKSAIALRIAAYKYDKGDIDSLLIISPNDVHRQWSQEQIPKWLPRHINREVQTLGGRGGMKESHPFYYPDYLHIVSVNIDTFSTPKKWEQIAEWVKATKCMVILDEATSIKNVSSKRTERLLYEFNDVVRRRKQVISSVPHTVARAILTGTPVTNGVLDLWSLFEFLRPNYFNRNYYSFRNHYAMLASITTAYGSAQILITPELWQGIKDCATWEMANAVFGVSVDTYNIIQLQDTFRGAYKHEEELKELIAPVSSFRAIEDCVDMPPTVYNKHVVTMSTEQTKAYKEMENELLAMYGGATTTAANKLSALIRLSQISSGFIVQGQLALNEEGEVLEDYDVLPGESVWLGSSTPKLNSLYRDIDETDRPCIIITRFTCEADRIFTDLSRQYRCCLYTGWKKTGTVEEFKEGKYDIMVANIRCISRGFNLQNACQMFFYSNTFSLEDRLQTEGRIFRIGQSKTCVYTDYINEGTIDLKVVGALRQKRTLLDYIRGTGLTAFVKDDDEITQMETTI